MLGELERTINEGDNVWLRDVLGVDVVVMVVVEVLAVGDRRSLGVRKVLFLLLLILAEERGR